MRTRATRCLAIVAMLVLFAVPVRSQEERKHEELPNFQKVNAVVYRGAQPKSGGVEILKQIGIKTVINLRDDDARAKEEESGVRHAGLQYFNYPLQRLGRPNDEKMKEILSIIDNPANQPVFVHCQHGADRTGVVIAIYRILHDGWTSEQATDEAKRYGLKMWQLGMKDYIHDFYKRQTAPASQPTNDQ